MKKFVNRTLPKIVSLVLNLLQGASCGLVALPWMFGVWDARGVTGASFALAMFGLLIMLYGAGLINVLLHEAGHLVMGLLTGYQFVSYRVLNVVLIRQDGKLRIKRFSIPGTAGQCLMKPPAWTEQGVPFKLYNWGGVLMNLLCIPLFAALSFAAPEQSLPQALLRMLAVTSFFSALLNGIPLGYNDARNVIRIAHSQNTMRAFWVSMTANAQLAQGMTTMEMPEEYWQLPDDADLSDPHLLTLVLSGAENAMLHHRFAEADAKMAALERDHADDLHPAHLALVRFCRLYMELIGENRAEVIEAMQTREFRQYQKAMRTSPANIRTQYALAAMKGNEAEKQKLMQQMDKLRQTYPYPRELEGEYALMRYADEVAAARSAQA